MTRSDDNGGFVLLVLLGVVGAGSLALLLVVQALVPPLADRLVGAERNLTAALRGASIAYRQHGVFPADLDALAVAAGLPADGSWRLDPFGRGAELDYQLQASGLQLRSRGPDGRLGTADDVQFDLGTEVRLRARTRLRLRLLRATLSQSGYRQAGTMSVGERLQVAAAMHDYASARRAWLTADAGVRLALAATMAAAAAVVEGLALTHGLQSLPVALTGAGGLMSQLGMPDGRAVDGRGAQLVLHPVLGFVAVGADGLGGSDDDM